MTPRPAISVLLTVFNRERFVGPAIESVLVQTYTDFELLVVDDGSTDKSVEVAQRYLSDPRVRILRNERNLEKRPQGIVKTQRLKLPAFFPKGKRLDGNTNRVRQLLL